MTFQTSDLRPIIEVSRRGDIVRRVERDERVRDFPHPEREERDTAEEDAEETPQDIVEVAAPVLASAASSPAPAVALGSAPSPRSPEERHIDLRA